jgi:2-haloacid dehalogenase
MENFADKPEWLTFDCYGTLILWDEGLVAAVQGILARCGARDVSSNHLIRLYDKKKHELECERPHLPFREVAGRALEYAMTELGLHFAPADIENLTHAISAMPPFPEVIPALSQLKRLRPINQPPRFSGTRTKLWELRRTT